MRKKVVKVELLFLLILLTGCGKPENDTAREFLNATQKEAKETAGVSNENETVENSQTDEQAGISREFIEERYPGKTILNYMYAEPEVWGGVKEHRYTDEQMVAVNDYLTENGQDYVLYFMPVELENMTLDYVLDVVNGDTPPDIITSVGYNEVVDNSTQKMVFNGVYQNLDEYSETEAYKKLTEAYPTGLYELSLYNGTFYGFKTTVFESKVNCYFYNKDVAEKYGIKKSDIEGKSLSDIIPVLDRLEGWGKDYKYSITASYLYEDVLNFIGTNFYFGNYEREPVFWLDSIGVDENTESGDIISITDSESVKKEYEALYEMFQKGYSCINGQKNKEYYYGTHIGDTTIKVNSFIESFLVTAIGNEIDTSYTSTWDSSQNTIVVPCKRRYTTDIGGWSMINGVCKNSGNKEKALEAIAYICSDEMLSNIMVRGVASSGYEVKNYTSKGEAEYSTEGTGNLGNQYLVKTVGDIDRQLAAKSMKAAKIETEIEGYYFDLSDYAEEVKEIKQIEELYLGVYEIPQLYSDEYENFEEAWNDFDKKLEEAGIDKVIAEINKQKIALERGLGK